MTIEVVDLLVVGLGPAGGAAAAQAAASGLRVLAIDRKREIGYPVQCAEFIPMPLQRYARRRDIAVQTIASMSTFLPSTAQATSAFTGLMIDRASFDRAFAERAHADGAEICLQTRLGRLDLDRSVARIDTRGALRDVHYASLIAADGPHSSVAKRLGLPALKVMYTRQYTVPLLQPGDATDIHLSPRYPGGYAWLFPKGRRANLGLGFEQRPGSADFKVLLDTLHADMIARGRVGGEILARTGGAIPIGGLRSRLSVGNVTFVGDAGGFTHPITGAGIAAAVVSGEHAAHAAAQRVKDDARGAFAEYEQDMRELYHDTLERALTRRREMARGWRTPAAAQDQFHRRGWIAFSDYYA